MENNTIEAAKMPPCIEDIAAELMMKKQEIIDLFLKTFLVVNSMSEKDLIDVFKTHHLEVKQKGNRTLFKIKHG